MFGGMGHQRVYERESPAGAQFDSPGHRPGIVDAVQIPQALKGRNKIGYCALSGLAEWSLCIPGALRRAIELRPFRAYVLLPYVPGAMRRANESRPFGAFHPYHATLTLTGWRGRLLLDGLFIRTTQH